MNPQAAQQYLRTKVLTATKEQLQLMLFDGAIRFADQGRAALEQKNFEASHKALTRAQQIVTELINALRTEVYPELCTKLAALYTYAHRHLVAANVNHKIEAVDEALKVLRYQRETWVMLMEQLTKARANTATAAAPPSEEAGTMEASISVQG
jgi:flagellar secretion chaperone FliS